MSVCAGEDARYSMYVRAREIFYQKSARARGKESKSKSEGDSKSESESERESESEKNRSNMRGNRKCENECLREMKLF